MTSDIEDLIAQLATDRAAAAAEQLAQHPEVARACIALLDCLGTNDEATRESVVAALENLEPPDADLAAIVDRLEGDPLRGYWAATLVGRLGPSGAAAVDALAAVVERPDAALEVRERATWALGRLGPAAQAARDVLARVAADNSLPRLARLAREVLGR
ncbi:MAG: hypothetical protein KDB14_25530 [Planctomycetales bacterium]|nr:hypothetical protein [Planctomycetales bacterium]